MKNEEYNPFKTAIHRSENFSVPIKKLLEIGVIQKDKKILDYGCGYGEDCIKLLHSGYNIGGYDKYNEKFKLDFLLDLKYDIVTCNYVFNVIPKQEHNELLKLLKSLGKDIYISVRADKKSIKTNWFYDKYKDVYITNKNTYQRFYTEETVKQYFGEVEYIINNNNLKLFKIKGEI